jgi:hypothetical protein
VDFHRAGSTPAPGTIHAYEFIPEQIYRRPLLASGLRANQSHAGGLVTVLAPAAKEAPMEG